jgi:hypothetical protein
VTPFTLPESLAEHTVEQLEELRAAALADFQATFAITPRTPDTLSRLESLADAMQTIRTEKESRDAIDATAQSLADRVATEFAATGPADDADEDAPEIPAGEERSADDSPGDEPTNEQITREVDKEDEEEDAEPMTDDTTAPTDSVASASPADVTPAPADVTPAPAPVVDTPLVVTTPTEATGAPVGTTTTSNEAIVTTQTPSTPTHAQEPVPVAASASTPSAGTPSATALNAHRDPGSDPANTTPAAPRLLPTIVASANLPDHSAGAELSMDEMTDAFLSRLRSFPKNGRAGQMRSPVANIVKPFSDDLKVADGGSTMEAMERAVLQANLPGGSLVAAGGWCAPSETIYDLCALESTDGMLSLPAVQVSRGGIRHTTGPDFRTIYDGTGFTFTEAQAEAGEYDGGEVGDKPCAVVPCPEFTDDRLDVAGVCITSDILQDTAYPEMTRRFLEGALIAHGHRVNSLVIADLEAGSDAVSPTSFGSATTSLLSAVELVAEDIRYRNRMAQSAVMELVLPFWARGVARADLSNRLGVELLSVSNQMIDGWLRDRRVNPQYVYDWQDDMVDGGSGFGSATPQTAWPDTVDFLIYPAGTWVKGEQDVITVDAIYDSVNLPQNNFTAIFTEEGWMTMKRCHDSRIVTVADWNCFGDTAAGTACAT